MIEKTRVIFAISGASGSLLAQTMLQAYAQIKELEIHLVISRAAMVTLEHEAEFSLEELKNLAYFCHDASDLAAAPASGSWQATAMIICPCSMSSLGAIANGCGYNLIHRAADVSLKERRPLILAPRETPLNLIHLRNMVKATEAGAIIMPFMPAFYTGAAALEHAMIQYAGRVLDVLRIKHNLCSRWQDAS